ncbi:hypothetical protein H6G80_04415 [Nostoc sp. FACHB-87]|uniref:hypothetical protein n=1 Tax=Nostocales TaxID=1161 RepID=UPI001682C328|nr:MULTISPECIES: hypothetical protein [Nostocales]MBD2299465.1 hypothetical protein [Nostoc sp. FACHB-190]MBD2453317.1 hypothetical protein [Nostoc sp. FACHB-87]MBD2475441.1 hypothetical protein [Anabaena sp. FACHB-83]MBD2490213.1 hypothetical protein [Aulosira sp. FACHB-615]
MWNYYGHLVNQHRCDRFQLKIKLWQHNRDQFQNSAIWDRVGDRFSGTKLRNFTVGCCIISKLAVG